MVSTLVARTAASASPAPIRTAPIRTAPAAHRRPACLRLLWVIPFVVAGLCAPAAHADEHRWHNDRGFRGHEFREHEFRDHRFLDYRYHHDHYYPPVGFAFGALPYSYLSLNYGGSRFYFGGGVWYRGYAPGRFVVVAPPLGVVIPALPPYYTTIWVGGVPYYYANNVYYVQAPGGYMVTGAPPPANVVEAAPSGGVPPYVEQPSNVPPGTATARAPAPPPPAEPRIFAYPLRGQSSELQTADRRECHDWATSQSGVDQHAAPDDYRRAIAACLEARGYSVK